MGVRAGRGEGGRFVRLDSEHTQSEGKSVRLPVLDLVMGGSLDE